MKGYKAFEKGLICRGKQYAENTVFEENKAKPCECGMHYVINPLDALEFYPLIDNDGNLTEFAEVEALDEPVTDDGKKYCTAKLKVGAKMSFSEFVKAAVNFLYEKTSKYKSSGDFAQMASDGDDAQMASSGNFAQMASSGNCAQMASSGDDARMVSSGKYAQMASSGNFAQMASSGNFARMASSGYDARMASSGYNARMASSGNCARMVSSGYNARMASSGNCAQMASSGKYAVVCCAGANCVAKAKEGSWITLSEWEWNEEKAVNIPVCVKSAQVDGKTIKEDTFYKLVNGEFVEVDIHNDN